MSILRTSRAVWAESDDARLIERLLRVTNNELTRAQVVELVGGNLDLLEDLSPSAQQGALALIHPGATEVADAYEAVQGNTVDFVPIAYLDLARVAASLSAGSSSGRAHHRAPLLRC